MTGAFVLVSFAGLDDQDERGAGSLDAQCYAAYGAAVSVSRLFTNHLSSL